MEKNNQIYKTIGEVAQEISSSNKHNKKLNTHTLRFWEKHFKQIKPKILSGNRRCDRNHNRRVPSDHTLWVYEHAFLVDQIDTSIRIVHTFQRGWSIRAKTVKCRAITTASQRLSHRAERGRTVRALTFCLSRFFFARICPSSTERLWYSLRCSGVITNSSVWVIFTNLSPSNVRPSSS